MWLERIPMQKAPSGVTAGNGKGFPPEANTYNDDVSARVVKELRAERGVDVSNPRWKTIEALGQVVRAT